MSLPEFSYPLALWLLVPVGLLLLFSLLRSQSPTVSFLRSLALAALVLAIADPKTSTEKKTETVSVLVDVSGSMPIAGTRDLLTKLKDLLSEQSKKAVIYPFAGELLASPIKVDSDFQIERTLEKIRSASSGQDLAKTDLGFSALQLQEQTGTGGAILLTDGQQTEPELQENLAKVGLAGLKLYPLIGEESLFSEERLAIDGLIAPLTGKAGEKLKGRVAVKNSYKKPKEARLETFFDGKLISGKKISLEAAQTVSESFETPPLSDGLKRIKTLLYFDGQLVDEKYTWVSVKAEKKVLLLSGSSDDAEILKRLLKLKGYPLKNIIANGKQTVPKDLSQYSQIILNNVSKGQLPRGFLGALNKQVKNEAASLLLVGGPRSFGLGGFRNTALEKMSPLKFLPPQTKKRRLKKALVLVIDKSGSMKRNNKIESAKQAALSSINALKDDDYVSVVGFDSAPFVIIRLGEVGDIKGNAPRRLRNLTAAGKSNLYPGLGEAHRALGRSKAGRKHIIILSDGKIGDAGSRYIQKVNQIKADGITLSAVALGADADIPFMRVIASEGKGAFYHTLDPSRLPEIFLRDIKVSTGEKTLKENKKFEVAIGPSGLSLSNQRDFPWLRGLVETKKKPKARLELEATNGGKTFPLLAGWSYGKGKVIAFTSDSSGRWTLPWLEWSGFVNFWTDLIDSKLGPISSGEEIPEFELRHEVKNRSLNLDLSVFDPKLSQKAAPSIEVNLKHADGSQRKLAFTEARVGNFQAELPKAKAGDYQLEISYGSKKLPPVGISLYSEDFGEIKGRGLAISQLLKIAEDSKGIVNPDSNLIESSISKKTSSTLWFPWLVGISIFLILIEAFIREYYTFETEALDKK